MRSGPYPSFGVVLSLARASSPSASAILHYRSPVKAAPAAPLAWRPRRALPLATSTASPGLRTAREQVMARNANRVTVTGTHNPGGGHNEHERGLSPTWGPLWRAT